MRGCVVYVNGPKAAITLLHPVVFIDVGALTVYNKEVSTFSLIEFTIKGE